MTNREWLESLSDKELVLTLNEFVDYEGNCIRRRVLGEKANCVQLHYGCLECLLEVLQAEHKEYKNND